MDVWLVVQQSLGLLPELSRRWAFGLSKTKNPEEKKHLQGEEITDVYSGTSVKSAKEDREEVHARSTATFMKLKKYFNCKYKYKYKYRYK